MKIPGRIQSYMDELGLKSDVKAKLKKHLETIGAALPEHPSPEEAARIVTGAMKNLKIKLGASKSDDEVEEKPKSKEEKKDKEEKPAKEPKEEKPKAEKKEVKESLSKKLSFKAFLSEATKIEFRIEDSDLEEYANGIQFDLKMAKMPGALLAKIRALNINEDHFSEDGFTTITLENKNKEKLKKLFIDLGYVEVKKFS